MLFFTSRLDYCNALMSVSSRRCLYKLWHSGLLVSKVTLHLQGLGLFPASLVCVNFLNNYGTPEQWSCILAALLTSYSGKFKILNFNQRKGFTCTNLITLYSKGGMSKIPLQMPPTLLGSKEIDSMLLFCSGEVKKRQFCF